MTVSVKIDFGHFDYGEDLPDEDYNIVYESFKKEVKKTLDEANLNIETNLEFSPYWIHASYMVKITGEDNPIVESNLKSKIGECWGKAYLKTFDMVPEILNDKWAKNSIQFPRLLSEIRAIMDSEFLIDLASSMDLTEEKVLELFDRAEDTWEKIKEQNG